MTISTHDGLPSSLRIAAAVELLEGGAAVREIAGLEVGVVGAKGFVPRRRSSGGLRKRFSTGLELQFGTICACWR
jgi:hypothetical protein